MIREPFEFEIVFCGDGGEEFVQMIFTGGHHAEFVGADVLEIAFKGFLKIGGVFGIGEGAVGQVEALGFEFLPEMAHGGDEIRGANFMALDAGTFGRDFGHPVEVFCLGGSFEYCGLSV